MPYSSSLQLIPLQSRFLASGGVGSLAQMGVFRALTGLRLARKVVDLAKPVGWSTSFSPQLQPKGLYGDTTAGAPLAAWRRGWATLSSALPAAETTESSSDPKAGVRGVNLIRDVAIIAHVDHGKTTLMDRLLRQCGASLQGERVMDSNTLEKERGITIASKYTSMVHGGYTLNVVDTPGHADFGGEVERVLGMVDGALLLVDAAEGPLAQTKFVLAKALRRGLQPIVVFNKVDKPSVTEAMLLEVESKVFELFASLDATDEQLDFKVLYASAREGWASPTMPHFPIATQAELGGPARDMSALLDGIVAHVPPPKVDPAAPFQLLVSMIERDNFLGRVVTGRIEAGTVRVGDRVHALRREGGGSHALEEGKVVKIMKRSGMAKVALASASAGDIVSLAGLERASVTHTVAHLQVTEALPAAAIDPPTISMTFGVNDSPLGGRDGSQLTGPKIGQRLAAEAESNVSISVAPNSGNDAFEVQGRGELQLGVLIENMRREGFELSVSPPAVMYKEENGRRLEPIEEVIIEVDDQYAGQVIEGLSLRRGELQEMVPNVANSGRTRLQFSCPSRGLLGYRSVLSTASHGTALMHRAFQAYEAYRGPVDHVRKGALVSMAGGTITAHALMALEARGVLFVAPGEETYDGHVLGENSREEDMEVNPVRTKELTNIRAAGKDENVRLTPPRLMNLEEAIGYVGSDELIEVTPTAVRLRKRFLNASQRRQHRRHKNST